MQNKLTILFVWRELGQGYKVSELTEPEDQMELGERTCVKSRQGRH